MKKQNKKKKTMYFLLIMILIYIMLFFTNQSAFENSISFFFNTLKIIIPIYFLIFFLMTLTDYFITPELITKHLKEKSKTKSWFFAVIFGILSIGPPYLWYLLLKNLRNKGVSNGLIACFLYSRATAIAFIPLMLFYFGIKYF